jgi:hypothetical protein
MNKLLTQCIVRWLGQTGFVSGTLSPSFMRNKNKSPGLGFVLSLVLLSGLVTAGGFLLHGKLYWDTGKIFTQFRDTLHSINIYGEPAWWFPHAQAGSPGYYHSILGIPSCLSPAFAIVGAIAWILGRLQIFIQHYQPIYVFYFGFLIPGLFLHALYLLSKRIFSSGTVVRFILILGAFSPGITFNLSDVGYLEPTVYGLYFASAYWDFIKAKGRAGLVPLALSLFVLALTANHAFLYFNLFALPAFVLSLALFRGRRSLERTWKSLTEVSAIKWAGIFTGMILCFLPNAFAYYQGRDLVRSSLGETKHYPVEKLLPGNSLEPLAVSLPGFGFDFTNDRQNWSLIPLSNDHHAAYYYLGLLCLPFLILGLWEGRRLLRRPLFAMGILFFGVLSLSAYSPFFALLLQLPSPLRSCNHFSDATFKAGGFLILVFLAASGLSAFLRNNAQARRKLFLAFVLCFFASLMTHLYFFDRKVLENIYTGGLLFQGGLFTVVLLWWQKARTKAAVQRASHWLLLLVLLDVSTHTFLWVRHVWSSKLVLNSGWSAYHEIDETPSPSGLGIKVGVHRHFYTNLLLMYPAYFRMLLSSFNPFHLPEYALFFQGHATRDLGQEMESFLQGPKNYRSLALENADAPRLRGFFASASSPKEALVVSPQLVKLSYNERVLNVWSPEPALLFIRDAFSPYWKTKVAGEEVPISKAFGNFKAIPIPAGASQVSMRFRPPFIPLSIFAAYLLITLTFVLWGTRRLSFSALRRIFRPQDFPTGSLGSLRH